MTWVMIDDGFPEHPKFLSIGDDGIALWARALAYANKWLTDGFIPRVAVPRLSRSKKPFDVARKLVDARSPGGTVGLWEEVDGGYRFHDFHDYQPTATAVRVKRAEVNAKKSEAGRKGAAKRWQTDSKHDGKADSKPMADVLADERQTDSPSPSPDPKPGSNLKPPPDPETVMPQESPTNGGGGGSADWLDRPLRTEELEARAVTEILTATVFRIVATPKLARLIAQRVDEPGMNRGPRLADVLCAIQRLAETIEAEEAGSRSKQGAERLAGRLMGKLKTVQRDSAAEERETHARGRRKSAADDVQKGGYTPDQMLLDSDAHSAKLAEEDRRFKQRNAERVAQGLPPIEEPAF